MVNKLLIATVKDVVEALDADTVQAIRIGETPTTDGKKTLTIDIVLSDFMHPSVDSDSYYDAE